MNGYGNNIICLFLTGERERVVVGSWKNPCVRTGTLTARSGPASLGAGGWCGGAAGAYYVLLYPYPP